MKSKVRCTPGFNGVSCGDLARLALLREVQIVLTTHSPYILDELPPEARAQIAQTSQGKKIMYGVTPEFAMSAMDDVPQYECDLYVEDDRAERMILEIMAEKSINRQFSSSAASRRNSGPHQLDRHSAS